MDNEENTAGDEQVQESPNVKAIPLSVIAGLLGGGAKGVHEIGVQGSVIEQTKKFLEENMRVEPVDLRGPGIEEPVPAYLTSEGVQVIDPDEFGKWATAPRFRKGVANLTDLNSFIAHTNRYKDDHTVIFANDDRSFPTLTSVLNYHEQGADGAPRFGNHRSHLAMRLSDEWKAWNTVDGEAMTMANFARFLEDHIIDVLPVGMVDVGGDDDSIARFIEALGGLNRIADPAQLMSLAHNLQVNESSHVSQAQTLSSGEAKVDFQSTHETMQGGQSITVPTMFVLGIPVFKNGPAYQLFARLRYRKQGPSLSFWYELWRADRVFDKAFDESITKVQADTGLPVLFGDDEGSADNFTF